MAAALSEGTFALETKFAWEGGDRRPVAGYHLEGQLGTDLGTGAAEPIPYRLEKS